MKHPAVYTPVTKKSGMAVRRGIFRVFCLLSGLFVFTLSHNAYAAPPQKQDAEDDTTVRDLIEELYSNYEAVSRRLEELRQDIRGVPASAQHLLAPLTITVKKEKGFALSSLEIRDNGAPFWSHIYSPVENSAMDGGGRHQFFKGEIKKGDHTLTITYLYSQAKEDIKKNEISWTLKVGDEPVYMDIIFKKTGGAVTAVPRRLLILDGKEYVEPK